MDPRDFFSHPLSSVRAWAQEHERLIAVGLSRVLAVVFIIIAIVKLVQSLGML